MIRLVKYGMVGALGTTLRLSMLALLNQVFGVWYLAATAIAVESGMLHNFAWHLRWTWGDRSAGITWREVLTRLIRFQFCNCTIAMVVNLFIMRVLVGEAGMHVLAANVVAGVVSGLANFTAAEFLIFRPKGSASICNRTSMSLDWAYRRDCPL